MPVLTQYSNMPDDEFLRKLEADVDLACDWGYQVPMELWQEVLRRFETLGTRPTEDEYKELEQERDQLSAEVERLEESLEEITMKGAYADDD